MKTAKLKKIGMLKKGAVSVGLFGLTLVAGFLFPPIWIITAVSLFVLIGYRAEGRCPICNHPVEARIKMGSFRCRRCGCLLNVNGLLLSDAGR